MIDKKPSCQYLKGLHAVDPSSDLQCLPHQISDLVLVPPQAVQSRLRNHIPEDQIRVL